MGSSPVLAYGVKALELAKYYGVVLNVFTRVLSLIHASGVMLNQANI
ncbi:hypothetical protein [Thermosphaera sp.]